MIQFLYMNKTIKTILIALGVILVAIALAGMYKFNYLANKDSYDVDENKKEVQQVEVETEKQNKELGQKCFLKKTPAPEGSWGKGEFSYDFIKLNIEDKKVTGFFKYYPYGTDSQVGSFSGETLSKLSGKAYGEGSIYTVNPKYSLTEKGLDTGYGEVVPEVSCDEFSKEEKKFTKDRLRYFSGPKSVEDLSKLPDVKEQKLSQKELNEIKFYQTGVDLDNNYKTEEYLIYPMNMYFCGSGGCHLYITNKDGKVLSQMTVTKLPIYGEITDIENIKKGKWETLYVWSDGSMRKMVPDANGKYPTNPSMQEKVSLEELQNHPEKYYIIMDYLD